LLPLYDNTGRPLAPALHQAVGAELTERFGGLTAYTRAPAQGLWKEDEVRTHRDDIVIYEVMADSLDRPWWANYRQGLERRFRQREVVIRAQHLEVL
jgi:hypothetical protein